MQIFNSPIKNNKIILALGAESAGNFSAYLPPSCTQGVAGKGSNGFIYFSPDFGDLLEEKNWLSFQKAVLNFLKKDKVNCKTRESALGQKIKPDVIVSDLHPLMKTTLWGQELSKKYKANFIQIQHHHAHLFSSIGEKISQTKNYQLPAASYGLAMDGTGYGIDEHIWGGEVFKLKMKNEKLKIVEHIGGLENQFLLGGELAIQEPARMIISILSKFLSKKEIYPFVKKYYTKNEFELLHAQLEQNFNCIKTSSTGRILDAVSLLLGFCNNGRKYKHEPIDLLEKNSTLPYSNLKPEIIKTSTTNYELQTTLLFKYLLKNIKKDKKRLAATAQLYLAQGLYEIIEKSSVISHQSSSKNQLSSESVIPAYRQAGSGNPRISKDNINIFASGGITNNKIISNYFTSKNIYLNKTIPRGDAGLSFGQIISFLLNN